MSGKVYTKKGDKGYTSVMGTRTRFLKSDIIFQAIGSVDELNCYVGMIRSYNLEAYDDVLKNIQNNLFVVGSVLGYVQSKSINNTDSYEKDMYEEISLLETSMDSMSSELKPLKNFILPGGNKLICYCHLARTVCRRAERDIVEMSKEYSVSKDVMKYINRLSDYFFVLARKVCQDMNLEETIWTSN